MPVSYTHLLQASAILRHHLDVFVNYDDKQVNFEEAPSAVQDEETARLRKLDVYKRQS